MLNRRKFLALSTMTAPLALASKRLLARPLTEKGKMWPASLKAQGQPSVPFGDKPIVISTWDFGQAANEEAWKVLSKGGHALDAVEAGVKVPEADPNNQSVGLGGLPDRDGKVTLDACIMDGMGNCGGVAALEHVVHAISVARKVMENTPHVLLVGQGATQFALEQGFPKENLLTPKSEAAWKEWLKTSHYQPVINVENQLYHKQGADMPGGPNNHDTIGMVAIDASGKLGGACTTSGMAFKLRGRVGDSPIIGAGLYVDDEAGAATSTGVGEEVIRICGSHLVVELMRQGRSPQAACEEAVKRIVAKGPDRSKTLQVGFLAINPQGEIGAYALQKGFTYAVRTGNINQVYPAPSYYA
jgi:N4-(beta-N-acetylglucosaminyl)-L-asparaginase